jgi:hypothetical protein
LGFKPRWIAGAAPDRVSDLEPNVRVPHGNIGIDRSVSAARSAPAFCLLAEEIVPSPFCAVGAVG